MRKEKSPRLSKLFWVSQKEFKVCIRKSIYNARNLPLLLITQCWGKYPWVASSMNMNPPGLGMGSFPGFKMLVVHHPTQSPRQTGERQGRLRPRHVV